MNLLTWKTFLPEGIGFACHRPGQPEESHLLALVSSGNKDERMPPKGDGLDDHQLGNFEKWILQGGKLKKEAKKVSERTLLVDDPTFLRRVWIDALGMASTRR